jgi:hypothetical protein
MSSTVGVLLPFLFGCLVAGRAAAWVDLAARLGKEKEGSLS